MSNHLMSLALLFIRHIAIRFRKWIGGEHKINEYCHGLAMKGGVRLAEVLHTKVMDHTGELTLNMASFCRTLPTYDAHDTLQTNVLLPLPVDVPGEPSVYTHENLPLINVMLREKLLDDWSVYAAHYWHAGAWWVRASAQVWNEVRSANGLHQCASLMGSYRCRTSSTLGRPSIMSASKFARSSSPR